MAHELSVVDGIQSALPLFAQIASNSEFGRDVEHLNLGADEDGPMDAMLQRNWHLQALKVREAWQYLNEQRKGPGEGVTIAVLDAGYTDHPEIFERSTKVAEHPDKVQAWICLMEMIPETHSMGTHHLPFQTPLALTTQFTYNI